MLVALSVLAISKQRYQKYKNYGEGYYIICEQLIQPNYKVANRNRRQNIEYVACGISFFYIFLINYFFIRTILYFL